MDSNHHGVIQRVLLLPPPAPTTGAPPTMRIPKMLRSKDSNLDGVIRSSRPLITSTHHWAVSPIPPDLIKWRLSIPTAIALYDGHPRLSFLRDGTGTLRRDLFLCRGDRDRTCDLMVPNHARFQLRHAPFEVERMRFELTSRDPKSRILTWLNYLSMNTLDRCYANVAEFPSVLLQDTGN